MAHALGMAGKDFNLANIITVDQNGSDSVICHADASYKIQADGTSWSTLEGQVQYSVKNTPEGKLYVQVNLRDLARFVSNQNQAERNVCAEVQPVVTQSLTDFYKIPVTVKNIGNVTWRDGASQKCAADIFSAEFTSHVSYTVLIGPAGELSISWHSWGDD